MADSAEQVYERVCAHVRRTALLSSIEELLGWDERTMLPKGGGGYRAEQITLLSGMVHERWTDPRLGDWLGELAAGPLAADRFSDTGANLRWLKREHERRAKLPKALVEELARTAVLGQQAWDQARKNDDFAAFRPLLEKLIGLKRQEAEALGYSESPYDALLDEYEPDQRTSQLVEVLGRLRDELVPLVDAIRESGRRPDASILARTYPVDMQESFGREAAARIGFDFERGRLDVTNHPFCCSPGPDDCRITTRYDEHAFAGAFFGILHEAGHGIYEQGLRADQAGLPLGQAVSLGLHESQSRMWENLVGRSRAFWEHFFPLAKRRFSALTDVALDDFCFAINDVRPSLIRVEADEATYNLHILIRFELERALLEDDLQAGDLPGAWNEKYRGYLGIEPPNDADGVLQDIHWSAGLVGYFPTYTLGNLYAAQFFARAEADLGGLADSFRRGDFRPLFDWLRANIHRQGRRYSAGELVEHVTGAPLSHGPLVEHLRGKFEPLYGGR